MKASETNVDRFLSTPQTTFAIPVYQRNYDWTLPQCKQLLNDILEAGKNTNIKAHFIGSIVYVQDDIYTPSDLNELTIIDGQQRLTTITLIYTALYRIANELNNQTEVNRIQKTYLINEFANDEEKLKLKPTDNNKEALKYILWIDDEVEYKNGYSKIIENFEYVRSIINADNLEIIKRGLSKLIFIDISLDRNNDNPQRIFESLNSTGLELSQADLIRNYILMGPSRKNQDKVYKGYWELIENNARDETLNKTKVSEFIRDYLTLKNNEIPNKGDVYATFKIKYPTSTIEELEPTLRELRSLVKYYNKLTNPKNETDNEIRNQLEYINRLEINVAFPFLMKVYEDFYNAIIDKVTFIAILSIVQSFTFRRFIVGLPTNVLNKVFMNLYDKVDKNNYLFSIQKLLLQKSGPQRFPNNTEVKSALKEKDVYNMKSKNRTYLLERLENYQNNEPVTIEGNHDITIEHIFPQNPHPKWKIELGEENYNLIKERYLNTIGNLTLSGNNGKLGNKPFLDKKFMNIDGGEQGYIYSRLWLNRDLKELTKWDKENIERRASLISERFINVWGIPDIDLETTSDEINIFDAEDPTARKLEYIIFFDKKHYMKEVTQLYIEVFKQLFELDPERFFSSEISDKISLTKTPRETALIRAAKISDSYFIETNMPNIGKFDRIKQALTIFSCEDELFIKYSN